MFILLIIVITSLFLKMAYGMYNPVSDLVFDFFFFFNEFIILPIMHMGTLENNWSHTKYIDCFKD